MKKPRYEARAHYRTRRSCRERIALCPSLDLGATALDRPIVGPIVAPRVAPPRRRRSLLALTLRVVALCALGGATLGALAALLLR